MIDIEGAIPLTEVVEASLVVPDCIAVFATEGGELGVLALLAPVPDVSGNGGDGMLAPDIFVALDVGVEDLAIA